MQLGEKTWKQAGELTGKVVVVPIGSMEQHGHHLPLLTDTLIGNEVVQRAEALLGDEALFLPMLWIGASDHHRAFPGTVSLSIDTYTRVIKDMLDSLIGAGYRRIFLLNSHAGNVTPAMAAITDKQIQYRFAHPDLWLTFVSWFELINVEELEGDFKQKAIVHACEWETSVIQAARPDLVGDDRPAIRRNLDSAFYSPDFRRPSRIAVARTMEQMSPSGAFGFPNDATPEKGNALMDYAAAQVAAFARDFATWPDTLDEAGELAR